MLSIVQLLGSIVLVLVLLAGNCGDNTKNTNTSTTTTTTTTTTATTPAYAIDPNLILEIGNRGGFTGATNKYVIAPDGKVHNIRTKALSDTIFIKTLNKMVLSDLHKKAKKLKLDTYDFKHKGNMTFFVRYNDTKAGTINEIRWGDPNFSVKKEVEQFYQSTLNLVIGEE